MPSYLPPTCSGFRYDTSFTTCLPLNKLLRKQMSKSLFIAVPNIRLKPKSVSKLMYLSSTCFIRHSFSSTSSFTAKLRFFSQKNS